MIFPKLRAAKPKRFPEVLLGEIEFAKGHVGVTEKARSSECVGRIDGGTDGFPGSGSGWQPEDGVSAGSVNTDRIARWDGTNRSPLGSGMNDSR